MVLDPSADDAWRGVATEDVDEVTTAVGIKLQARSRRLLKSLLAPHRRLMWLAGLIVVFDQALFLAGPLVVAYGIDTAVPALAAGNGAPLVFTTLAYLIAGTGGALHQGDVRAAVRPDHPGRAARHPRPGVRPQRSS